MFGLGGQELFLILIVVLLFFGPQKLPELMRGLGKGMKEFKKAQADLEDEFTKAVETSAPKNKPVESAAAENEQEGSAPENILKP
jgi:sec-independent protein translocase protein TatA